MEIGLVEDEHDDLLRFGLFTRGHSSPPQNQNGPPPPLASPPSPSEQGQASSFRHLSHHHPYDSGPTTSRNGRSRKSRVKIGQGKSQAIEAPYPWATTSRAVSHPLKHLLAAGVTEVSGQAHCKSCDRTLEIRYELERRWAEVAAFVRENKHQMHDRAPAAWMNPVLPDCSHCHQSNCVKPVLGKKRAINWLFLLLGQMIGCCRLSELKYFCKHTKNHRTGAKDRVLYLTYLGICKQLDPDGPFDP